MKKQARPVEDTSLRTDHVASGRAASLKCSQTSTSAAAAGKPPRGAGAGSPSVTIRRKVPADCFALLLLLLLLLLFSFDAGTHPDTNEDWLLSFFCRCGVFAVIKRRPVNDESLQNRAACQRHRDAKWREEAAYGCRASSLMYCHGGLPEDEL
ncbi:unnamed protein product [Pleuronectes platessa]|uniref:Uncharacterized protein n=1 Tax=Pleuronectes platessa TaxID=8262 RepID=A0A9N7UDA4_PLEPL|nr:unnamed protein product [Pleuronectes platessa]